MREKDIVQTVTIKHQAVGTEATKAAVNSVTDAVKGLGDAAQTTGVKQEQAARRQASALAGFEKLERSVSPAAKALADYERAQRLVGRAVDQNAALQDRGNAVLQAFKDRLSAAGSATGDMRKETRLARHELINLSRQVQDVGVSLASGQSPMTVLIQQGTQIADIFASSGASVRGALSGIAASLRNMFSVGRVAFGALAAGAAGAALATADYLSEQKNLERSLIGNRQATPAAINQIAGNRSSLTGLSISETREAALEFAKTGQIHSRVIGDMIETTKNFALVTGQSAKEAAASLAKVFTDISGIEALNKQFNFLDGATRNYIESLLFAGRTTEAAAVANSSLSVVLKQVEATQGGLEKGWTAIGNAISNATSKVGEYIARSAGLERKSRLDSAVGVANEIEGLQSRVDRGDFNNGIGDTKNLDDAKARIEELRSTLRQLNRELGSIDGSGFNAISLNAQQAINSLNPFRGKILEIEGAVTKLKAAMAAGFLNPEIGQALAQYELILQNLRNQEAAQARLLAQYPGMTTEFAKQVQALEQQNRLLKARESGNEAAVSAAIAYENAIAAGANKTEAAAIQALTLKNNLMQAASAAASLDAQLNLDMTDHESIALEKSHRADRDREDAASLAAGNGDVYHDWLYQAWRQMQRAPSSQSVISGALSGGVNSALSSLMNTNVGAGRSYQGVNFNSFRKDINQNEITQAVQDLFGLKLAQAGNDNASKQAIYQEQLAWLQQQPGTIQNLQQQVAIQRAMKDLTDAVNANTDAQNASLNPLYSEGRSALKIGYYKAATGLEGIVGGSGGVDSQLVQVMATPGEHFKFTPPGQVSNDNSKSTTINNVFNFGEAKSTNRRSKRQFAQGFADTMAAFG